MAFRKYPMLFWPAFLFFAFHNYFPNKQERFILPILPLFLIAGLIGWYMYMDKSKFWTRNQKIFRVSLIFFWIINFIALPVFSTTYSKKSRCETMYYLGQLEDANTVILEESTRTGVTMFPFYYGGRNIQVYLLDKYNVTDSIRNRTLEPLIKLSEVIVSPQEIIYNNWPNPEYIAFINENDLENRLAKMRIYYPNIEYIKTIYPSYIDLLMKKITPSNNNQLVFIYKVNN